MRDRTELDDLLKTFCNHVYFQPPESLRLEYPCIIYSMDKLKPQHADNRPYILHRYYSMRYITWDPDDPLVVKLAELPKCEFSRVYTKNNLYHHSYTIFY